MNKQIKDHLDIDIRYCYSFNKEYNVDYYDECMAKVNKLCDERQIEDRDLILLATAFHRIGYNQGKSIINDRDVILYYNLEKRHKVAQIILEYLNNEKDCLPETQILYDALNN